jgi:nucleoside-diphosphate-sugar epimerase
MQKILVTGCAGFIGSHLCRSLLEKGNTVYGIDNFDPFYPREIKEQNLETFLHHPNFTFTELDLSDKEKLDAYPFASEIEIIVHLAGKAGVRPSIDDPAGYIRANIVATQNILDMMKTNGIKKMAFASSSSVYGNSITVPFREDADVSSPVSPYAFSKKACELINYTYHHLYQLDIINLRFFTVYGPSQRPDLAIHKFLKLMRTGKDIPMFGDGSTARDYTFVEDTVAGIQGAINYLVKNDNVFETINLGNNHPVKLGEMIAVIAEKANVTPVIKHLPEQPGDVTITFADITKAQKMLGYQPKTPFREGVQKFVEWYDKSAVGNSPL